MGINAGSKIGLTREDKIFYLIVNILLTVIFISVLYPLIYVVSASFSSTSAVSTGKVILWPVDFSLDGYKAVFRFKGVYTGYRNSIFYTVAGTIINVFITMIAVYPLARASLPFRNFLTFMFTFTMLFSGGLVPGYILVRNLGMINSVWVMLIPGALSVYNMIVARTFIQSNIASELLEAAQIDGCSDAKFFMKIVLPLSKALLAVLVIFYAVGHWNSYFQAFIYLNDRKLYPLQIFLREILIMSQIDAELINDPELAAARQGLADLLKYALIIVATVPILLVYPFAQKHFVKGVMIGSLKG